jgi:hypothetical protein
MPKIEFEDGYKKKGNYDFDKLTLEQGERARVCVLENPTVEYVHVLNRVILDRGQPVMTTQVFGKNGEKSREVPETDYVGRFLCLGNFEVLEAKSVDPDNCPACKASLESAAVDRPKRRFAAHVLKYQVKKNSFTIQDPFQVSLQVWDFTDTRYDALVDIKTEHGALPNLDLNLGPCENKNFQKYTFSPGNGCEWSKSADRKKIVQDVLKTQKVDDLSLVLGRKSTFGELNSQVQDVVHTWNIAFGTPGSMPDEKPAADEAPLDLSFDEPTAGDSSDEDGPTQKPSGEKKIMELDDLLAGM